MNFTTKICIIISIHILLLLTPKPIHAIQCRKTGDIYNCENKVIYRKIGNRIFGPNGSQFLIQGDRISQIGENTTYTKIGNKIFKNNQTHFTRQNSYIQRMDGKSIVKDDNLFLGEIDEDFILVDLLLNGE